MTVVHSRFILASFLHIRNISAVTFFWAKIFLTYFFTKIFLDPTLFGLNFFGHWFFWPKNIFHQNNKIIKIMKIIKMIKIIEISKINEIIKMIQIIKSIMSCMSSLLRGQWSTDKIISALVYIFRCEAILRYQNLPDWQTDKPSPRCF